jgi:hypothetical protein
VGVFCGVGAGSKGLVKRLTLLFMGVKLGHSEQRLRVLRTKCGGEYSNLRKRK